ncbi:MAG: hypothetical protein LBH73_08625 [Spirochaetaceae bacterium]|jgi:hypothetical protein|nr:hypothetical protein [Spirochaetaceae bacterium]
MAKTALKHGILVVLLGAALGNAAAQSNTAAQTAAGSAAQSGTAAQTPVQTSVQTGAQSAARSAVPQDKPTREISDDSALRISLADAWFNEIPSRVLNRSSELYRLPGGDHIEVRAERGNAGEFMVILARGRNGSYPGWIQGSWILTRNTTDGKHSRIRVFLRSDPYTYVQFRPLDAGRSQMDVVLYEGYAARSLTIPLPFARLLSAPLEEIFSTLGDRFPRRYFDPEPELYRDSRNFISRVRARLPELSFVDDGARDEEGRYVYINTLALQNIDNPNTGGLNCSGFAKWIVDGILRPITGRRLAIEPLKAPYGERGSSFTEAWERARDPYFGLDWTRNLAAEAARTLRSSDFDNLDEIEVRADRTANVIMRSGGQSSLRSYPGFLPDAGFGIEGLHALLYTLAIDEPGKMYLASINTETGAPVTEANPRGAPRLRQHFHVAALVPHFTENGVFQVALFESAEETSFTRFKNRYPGHYVNLTRISLEPSFDP